MIENSQDFYKFITIQNIIHQGKKFIIYKGRVNKTTKNISRGSEIIIKMLKSEKINETEINFDKVNKYIDIELFKTHLHLNDDRVLNIKTIVDDNEKVRDNFKNVDLQVVIPKIYFYTDKMIVMKYEPSISIDELEEKNEAVNLLWWSYYIMITKFNIIIEELNYGFRVDNDSIEIVHYDTNICKLKNCHNFSNSIKYFIPYPPSLSDYLIDSCDYDNKKELGSIISPLMKNLNITKYIDIASETDNLLDIYVNIKSIKKSNDIEILEKIKDVIIDKNIKFDDKHVKVIINYILLIQNIVKLVELGDDSVIKFFLQQFAYGTEKGLYDLDFNVFKIR